NPAELLEDLSTITDCMGVWTHYYNQAVITARPELARRFETIPHTQRFGARTIVMHQHNYLEALQLASFYGGSAPFSRWMTKDDILGFLADLGYSVEIGADQSDHPNGPCMLFLAARNGPPPQRGDAR